MLHQQSISTNKWKGYNSDKTNKILEQAFEWFLVLRMGVQWQTALEDNESNHEG